MVFLVKTTKVNTNTDFCIIKSICPIFSLNWQFRIFGQVCPKRVFPVENRKNGHHHWILYIWISLGTKFQLKLIILIFGPNLLKEGISGLKQNNCNFAHAPMVIIFYIKFLRKGADRHNIILMSLLLLVAETKTQDPNNYFLNTIKRFNYIKEWIARYQ